MPLEANMSSLIFHEDIIIFFRIGDNWPDEGYRLDFSIDPKYEVNN